MGILFLIPGSNEWSFKTNAGITNAIGTFKLFYDYNNQKLGLVEDEAIEAIAERGRKKRNMVPGIEYTFAFISKQIISGQI